MLKTANTASFDSAAGAMASHLLILNSCYDPTGNGGTGQPLGFSQYTALYNKYCVVGWKLEIQAVSTDNSAPIVVGFTPTTQASATGAYLQNKEMPGSVIKVVTPDQDKTTIFTRGSVKKWLMPTSGKMLTDDTLSAATSTDPSRKLYGHIFTQGITAADPAAVNIVYTLTQIVVFFDPKVPSRSSQ